MCESFELISVSRPCVRSLAAGKYPRSTHLPIEGGSRGRREVPSNRSMIVPGTSPIPSCVPYVLNRKPLPGQVWLWPYSENVPYFFIKCSYIRTELCVYANAKEYLKLRNINPLRQDTAATKRTRTPCSSFSRRFLPLHACVRVSQSRRRRRRRRFSLVLNRQSERRTGRTYLVRIN